MPDSVQGLVTTTAWVYDHVFADTYALPVPAQFTGPPTAEIVPALVAPQTLQRLPVAGRDTPADEAGMRFGQISFDR